MNDALENINPLYAQNDCVCLTSILTQKYPSSQILEEIKIAEKQHGYKIQGCVGWYGLPLRSANGVVGFKGVRSKNENNSPDPNIYKDTELMTPTIRKMLDELKTPILKVRILKLKAYQGISYHVDKFQGGSNVMRLHYPLITNSKIEFFIGETSYYMTANNLWYANVRKQHKVMNNSGKDRIHLVIDIERTPDFDKKFEKNICTCV